MKPPLAAGALPSRGAEPVLLLIFSMNKASGGTIPALGHLQEAAVQTCTALSIHLKMGQEKLS